MHILVKYPTRQRPELFLKTLKGYVDKATDLSKVEFLISIDSDDLSTQSVICEAGDICQDVTARFIVGEGNNKIEACNRDIDKVEDWDIVILVSDDMECIADGWDERLRIDFQKFFPDTDGCLWYHDGAQSSICTLSVIGRKYYDRFNYIYHPSYKSFFCDNEFTEVARREGKMQLISRMIIKHQHPSWGGNVLEDELYKRNNRYWNQDESNYYERKRRGFQN